MHHSHADPARTLDLLTRIYQPVNADRISAPLRRLEQDPERVRAILDPKEPHQQPKDNDQDTQPDVYAYALLCAGCLSGDEEGEGEDAESE